METETKPNFLALPGAEISELEQEQDRLEQKEISSNTRKAYDSDFAQFEKWCAQIRRPSIPANDYICDLYVCFLNKQKRTPGTIARALTAISKAHQTAGLPSPIGDQARRRLSQVKRDRGTSVKKAAPITVEHLKNILTVCPRDFLGVRDRALLLVGWTAALRRSSIVALDVEDLEERSGGLVLTLKKSKTDQEGRGYKIGLPLIENELFCPVRALRKWLDLSRITEGPIFRVVGKRGLNTWFSVTKNRLSDRAVSEVIKKRAREAGYDSTKYSGHSLRSGFCTSAAAIGVSERVIMKVTGHRSEKTVRDYIQDGTVFLDHPAIALLL